MSWTVIKEFRLQKLLLGFESHALYFSSRSALFPGGQFHNKTLEMEGVNLAVFLFLLLVSLLFLLPPTSMKLKVIVSSNHRKHKYPNLCKS